MPGWMVKLERRLACALPGPPLHIHIQSAAVISPAAPLQEACHADGFDMPAAPYQASLAQTCKRNAFNHLFVHMQPISPCSMVCLDEAADMLNQTIQKH